MRLHLEPAHPESLISPEVHVKPFKLISQKDLTHQPGLGLAPKQERSKLYVLDWGWARGGVLE